MKADENMTIHAFKRLLLTQVKKPFFFAKETFGNDEILKNSIFADNDTISITYDLDEWKTKIKNLFNMNESVELVVKKNEDVETVIENMRDINPDIGTSV